MHVPLGWQTDLEVLRLAGATVEERGDHLVVSFPTRPEYYWGNFVYADAALDDAAGWLALFEAEFPDAVHRSIGLAGRPSDPAAWSALDLKVESADVLAAERLPDARPLPSGYLVRELDSAEEWAASTSLRQAAFPAHPAYEAQTTGTRIKAVEAGHTRWFGAFTPDGALASELGIVDLGDGRARYQSVVTDADHRRRGLTSHLLGVAAGWAWARGCRTLVIIADTGSDAGRLYASVGFEHRDTSWQAARTPPEVS